MAFRGYELNLMLRVQDRASTRIRRLASDLGGVNRAAQMQRDAARVSRNAFTANAIAERDAARNRLLGLTSATNASQVLTTNLNRASAAGRLTADEVAQIEKNFRRATAAQKAFTAGRVTAHVGAMGTLIGGVATASLAGAANTFATFNTQTTKAATQMRDVGESFTEVVKISKVLDASILDMTRRFPSSAGEMAEAAYEIASGMDFAGNAQERFAQTNRVLEAANKVAVAGFTDLKSATDALLITLNNFAPKAANNQKKLNEVINQLFAIVRFGKGDFTEFAQLFGPVSASANAAGQSLIEAGGALAFLTTRLPHPQASAGLQRLLQIMSTKDFIAGFKEVFGTSATIKVGGVEKLKQLSDLVGIIILSTTKLPEDISNMTQKQLDKLIIEGGKLTKGGVELSNLLQSVTAAGQNVRKGTTDAAGQQGTIQARRALTNLIVGWEQYRDVLQNVMGDTTEFNKSFAAGIQAPGVRWTIAINQFKAFAIVVGQSVLPVMLRFFDFIGRLAHRFEDLSRGTRGTIGSIAAWSSLVGLLGGLVLTLVGGLTMLFSKLLMVGTGFGAALTTASKFWMIVRRLSLIGTIAITIKILKGGDPSVWDMLGLAGAGAALGFSRGGLPGAVLLGTTIPLTVKAAAELKKPKDPIREAYDKYLKDLDDMASQSQSLKSNLSQIWSSKGLALITGTKPPGAKSFEDFRRDFKRQGFEETKNARQRQIQDLDRLKKKNAEVSKSILDNWRQVAQQLTGLDVFGKLSGQLVEQGALIQMNLAKAQAGGDKATIAKNLKTWVNYLHTREAELEKLPKTAQRVATLTQLYQSEGVAVQELNDLYKDQTKLEGGLADEKIRAAQQAKEDQTNKIKTAVDNLAAKYKELEDANRSAFQLFSGPVSQGPIAGIYNQINQLLMGFGQKPIAIPITLQMQDLTSQVRNFELFRKDLAALSTKAIKQLGPEMGAKFIEELRAKGVEALPILEGLQQAGPGAFKSYLAMWERGQKDITTATDKDMSDTLKMWESYGRGIAWQIVQGLASDKAQANLKRGFKKYIIDTFGKQMKDELDKAVQKAVADWMKIHENDTSPTTKKVPKGTTPSGPTRNTQNVTHHHGDNVQIHADGATPHAVNRALQKKAFLQRNKK